MTLPAIGQSSRNTPVGKRKKKKNEDKRKEGKKRGTSQRKKERTKHREHEQGESGPQLCPKHPGMPQDRRKRKRERERPRKLRSARDPFGS